MSSQSLTQRIHRRARTSFFRWRYLRVVRKILDTKPLVQGSTPFLLLSMVHKRDVLSYLLAVKSFARLATPAKIVVVCDPSLGRVEKDILRKHIPHVELRAADEFVHPNIPRGGTWERLYAISAYTEHHYVVQLDADTLTTQPVPEVMKAITESRGFVLGERTAQQFMTLSETAANAQPGMKSPPLHIQTIVEANIDSVALPAEARYVRGCSGFTGFPRSTHMREQLLDFSTRMQQKFGKDWIRWGTEQITSNYIVANAANPVILPFPKYGTPDVADKQTAFFHFIGSMRFVNDRYRKTSKQVLKELNINY